jgi:hypothetical protein
VFSRDFGTHQSPNFVLDVFKQAIKVGQPVILFRTSNSDPAEDFTVSYQGQVSAFYQAGLVSPAVDLHYGGGCELYRPVTATPSPSTSPNVPVASQTCAVTYPDLYAWELEYSPYGVESGLCAGVGLGSTAVSLQPCGVSGRTVWITDTTDATGFRGSYVPVINGSDTNFSHPVVLTYPAAKYPTDAPRPQLYISELTGFSGSILNAVGVVDSAQEYSEVPGVLK